MGLGMILEGKHFYIKDDIFSFINDLLHLLMKFGTVGSVRVGKDHHPNSRLWVTHH